ncbi:MAG: hypothetical protein H6739_17305 [Alphaproteobacteria bacterium]|nr:hypothetical protein [Alphaproteobacteria bacterium]
MRHLLLSSLLATACTGTTKDADDSAASDDSSAEETGTDDTGDEVVDSPLVGKVFLLESRTGRIVEPPGVGSILESYLEGSLLVEVVQVRTTQLDLRVAPVSQDNPREQDLCSATAELTFTYAEPRFSFGPQDLSYTHDGDVIAAQGVTVQGGFAAGLEGIRDISAAGLVDTRPMVDRVEEGGEPDAICQIVSGFGVACEPCADGETLCLQMEVIDLVAEETDATLIPIEGDCHESCQDRSGRCLEPGCRCGAVTGPGGAALFALLALAGLRRRR